MSSGVDYKELLARSCCDGEPFCFIHIDSHLTIQIEACLSRLARRECAAECKGRFQCEGVGDKHGTTAQIPKRSCQSERHGPGYEDIKGASASDDECRCCDASIKETPDRHSTILQDDCDCCGESENRSTHERLNMSAGDDDCSCCSHSVKGISSNVAQDDCSCCDAPEDGFRTTSEIGNLASDASNTPCCVDRVLKGSKCITSCDTRVCHSGPCSDSASTRSSLNLDACDMHLRLIKERYASVLESFGCACKTLLAKAQRQPCCTSGRVSQLTRSQCKDQGQFTAISSSVSLAPSAIRLEKRSHTHTREVDHRPKSSSDLDVEKGPANWEHVVLSVSGMTCTGCERTLYRTLAKLLAVTDISVSVILSQAKFQLDMTRSTVDDVIRHIHRTTQFTCERMTSPTAEGRTLDVLVSDHSAFLLKPLPRGVKSAFQLSKETFQIVYDPHVVGARDVLQNSFQVPLRLAPPSVDNGARAGRKHVRDLGFHTLLSAVLTVPVLVMSWAPLPSHDLAYGITSLILATIIQIFIARPFYPQVFKSLIFTHVIEMDLLIVLSTSTAYVFSVISFALEVAGRPLSTGQFFETCTLLVTLIMVGRFVAAHARQSAIERISISAPKVSDVTIMENGIEVHIDPALLQYGDTFLVDHDSVIPTDGIIISGSTEVDESMLTGESLHVPKAKNDLVRAGTLNGSGRIAVKLTRLPGDNTISDILAIVEQAKMSKPKVEETANRVAGYIVPTVLCLSLITFIVWMVIGVTIRHDHRTTSAVNAVTYAIAVLIVSCPCALGLAVPMVVVCASGVAARHGIIFKDARILESAKKVKHIVLDKTGTLTEGRPSVCDMVYLRNEDDAGLMLGLTSQAKHPISVAVTEHLRASGVCGKVISNVKNLPGKGVVGTVEGKVLRFGNSHWLGVEFTPEVQTLLNQKLTVSCLMVDEELVAIVGMKDGIRPDALHVILTLKSRGLEIWLASGDERGAVLDVATRLNVPEDHVLSKCSPLDKQEHVMKLLARGEHVLFCGDGTNDAAALSQATIGVHMSGGTDIACNAADVVLVTPSLSGVLAIFDIGRAALLRVDINFAWAFIYNLLAILLASGALVSARIPPAYAGLGELVSVLPVVLIALHLNLFRPSKVSGTQ